MRTEEEIMADMDKVVMEYDAVGKGMFANEDPRFAELFIELQKARKDLK